ncbi:hypothetical protein E2C01_068404 [Portunus trituberculatus]|uniref:Uncharacterized protein n=1 Tax=Portunus trituberculatus TaxID=210409 RepID=A0A5B7HWC9_PORTR|nr:hypothetical protein [Portunus trituberculatus]
MEDGLAAFTRVKVSFLCPEKKVPGQFRRSACRRPLEESDRGPCAHRTWNTWTLNFRVSRD